MIHLTFKFNRDEDSQTITVQLGGVRQARAQDHSAPWDVDVTITWDGEVIFDRPLSGADPLHAIELAAQFAATYLRGRAEDEGGALEPPIAA